MAQDNMIYYLSGSISDGGRKAPSFDGFYEAEEMLQKKGFEVFNPARLESVEARTWEWYLARDLKWISDNHPTMYMLKGWEQSQGARLEYEFAKLLRLQIEYENTTE